MGAGWFRHIEERRRKLWYFGALKRRWAYIWEMLKVFSFSLGALDNKRTGSMRRLSGSVNVFWRSAVTGGSTAAHMVDGSIPAQASKTSISPRLVDW